VAGYKERWFICLQTVTCHLLLKVEQLIETNTLPVVSPLPLQNWVHASNRQNVRDQLTIDDRPYDHVVSSQHTLWYRITYYVVIMQNIFQYLCLSDSFSLNLSFVLVNYQPLSHCTISHCTPIKDIRNTAYVLQNLTLLIRDDSIRLSGYLGGNHWNYISGTVLR